MREEPVNGCSLPAPVPQPSGAAENRIGEILERIETDLKHIAEALSLVGLKRCSWCRKFVKSASPGALFNVGQLVCFRCIPDWWAHRSAELDLQERGELETKLAFWLRTHHRAEIVKQSGKLAESRLQVPRIVATCLQCRGTGTRLGNERCRYCDGFGTVWVLVRGWSTPNQNPAPLADEESEPAAPQ